MDIFDTVNESINKIVGVQSPAVRESNTHDRNTFVVEMKVTRPQGLALQAMFEYWNHLANIGGSRKVAFYVDGDGNFKPECAVVFNASGIELTDEMRESSVVEDREGDRVYDFDPVAWMLHDLEDIKEADGGIDSVGIDSIVEKLAALEHDQWMDWAKNILETEEITAERAERWKDLFIPYDELSEEMKELDREWARKVLKIVGK
jgi:hypothetical protein